MGTPRPVAVLFADVAGSTALYDRIGDAGAHASIAAALDALAALVEGFGGRVVKAIGDGLMCAFPDASNAMRAAVGMQLGQRAGELQLRIGFHFGEAIEVRRDLFGDTVNVAARITQLAKPAQILTTDEAVAALPEYLRSGTRRIGQTSLRGKSLPCTLNEVIWQPDADLTMVDPSHAPGSSSEPRLVLQYGARRFDLDPLAAPLSIGRGEDNDVVLAGPHASRLHARIAFRHPKFVLVDLSTNGTWVRVGEASEQLVRREEIALHDSGTIRCGSGAPAAGAGVLRFSVESAG